MIRGQFCMIREINEMQYTCVASLTKQKAFHLGPGTSQFFILFIYFLFPDRGREGGEGCNFWSGMAAVAMLMLMYCGFMQCESLLSPAWTSFALGTEEMQFRCSLPTNTENQPCVLPKFPTPGGGIFPALGRMHNFTVMYCPYVQMLHPNNVIWNRLALLVLN